MEPGISKAIDDFIAENEDAIVQDIAALVAQRSVQGPPAPGAPYGEGPRRALDAALSIARRLGLSARDGGGHVGWAELPGRESGYIATITHVDTVPEGDGWDADPLTLRRREGWLLGRGVGDDKGPGVLCLYAARFLAQRAQPLRYGLRVLLGCNEETGMEDVEHYLACQPAPLFCFSPDAHFPVCNGEKGVHEGTFLSEKLAGCLVEFSAGMAGNVIPQKAVCTVRAAHSRLPGTARITTADAGGGLVRLEAAGIAGHAAHPEGTLNAIGLLVDYLLQQGVCEGAEENALRMLRTLHQSTDGTALGIACESEGFTPLTCIGGVIRFEDGILRQSVNIRYPMAITGEEITRRLADFAARHSAGYAPGRDAPPFYIRPDSPAIQALQAAYTETAGRPAAPFTMGGGTYARHFPHAVSFGPADAQMETPPFAGPEHGANEGAYLPQLLRALKIYIIALLRLQEVDF